MIRRRNKMNLKNRLDADDKNLFKNIIYAFGIKGLSLFVSLFSMPLYIKYFDDSTVLGLWFTIMSVLSWINICDLGLGNGLRNMLTKSLALNDAKNGKRYVSSTYAMVTLIILPILLVGLVLLNVVNLNSLFNIPGTIVSLRTMRSAFSILLIGLAFSFVLKLIGKVIYAIQKPYINNVITLIHSIIPLAFIFFFKGKDTATNLIALSIVHILAMNVPYICATFLLFGKKVLKPYRFEFKEIDFDIGKKMLSLGTQFFMAQIFFMLLMSTNEMIVSKVFSPAHVVEYSIYYRAFTAIGSLFNLALTPLWSRITKDLFEKKYRKIKKTNKVLYACAFAAIIAQFLAVPFLQFAFNIWLGDETIIVNYLTGLIFALFGGMYILNIALTTVANGIGNLKSQMVFYGIGSLLKVPFAYFIKMFSLSWHCIVLYNAVVLGAFCIYQMFWVKKEIEILIKSEE